MLAHPTKPGRPAPGLELVRAVAGMRPDKPWFAIGGIDERRLAEVLDAGARRIVVVRAITAAEDPARPPAGSVRRWLLPADLGAAPGEDPAGDLDGVRQRL